MNVENDSKKLNIKTMVGLQLGKMEMGHDNSSSVCLPKSEGWEFLSYF